MNRRSFIVAALGCASLAGSTVSAAAQGGAAQSKIVFGLVLKSAFAWPVFVAAHKKMFEEQGLAVEIVTTGSSAKTAQQLVAGAIHIGEAGLVDHIRAIHQGAPLKIVAAEVGRPPYSLIAGKQFKSLADLKGKSVMVGGPNDVTRYFAQVLLRSAGLNEPDYDFVYSGSSPNRLAAVANGSAAAAILGQPFDFTATAQGYQNLGTIYDLLPDFAFAGYAVSADWAARNRDALVKLLKADLKAVRWLYDPANKAEAIAILSKETGTSAQDAEKTYDLYFTKIHPFPKDGRIPQDGFQKVLEAMATLGDLQRPLPPYSKFVDDSLITAAQ
jgi:NitT/TauT family transport system substrate-binding protein